jgi:hypothetical protein
MQNLLNSAKWNSLLPYGSHQVTGARLYGHSQIFNMHLAETSMVPECTWQYIFFAEKLFISAL